MTPLSRRGLLSGIAAATVLGPRAARAESPGYPGLAIEEQIFELPHLAPEHDGLRIAQLSDIHVGVATPVELIRAAIDAVNAAAPDLVALTGDYLSMSRRGVGLMREQLGGLQAPTVAILGNHDYWVDPEGAAQALTSLGYEVLRNGNTSIRLRNEPFGLVGIDDLVTGHADVERALRGAQPGSRLLLAHVPRTADELAARGLSDAVLSGHTHGGQVYIPGFTAPLMKCLGREPYVRGRFEIGRVQLHVNRGIGRSAIPVRAGAPPELTLVTLRAAQVG